MSGTDWQEQLRARGYRLTPQRRLVLQVVRELGHATPDDVARHEQVRELGVNPSTVYRTLEVLEKTGLIRHTHLGHGAPTYHPADAPSHVHLVCRNCQRVEEVETDMVLPLAEALRAARGFETDVDHLTIYGLCSRCSAGDA